jgi:endonuclease YncB( thermonuclease family)
MQFLPALVVVAVAVTQTFGSLQRSDPVLVRRVIDGATIDVQSLGRVRLLGLTDPFGRDARDRLASLVLQRWVRLEYDTPALAASRRHVAYVVREDGVFVNAALVRDGLARVGSGRALTRRDELQRAEREARTLRRGMWAPPAQSSRKP